MLLSAFGQRRPTRDIDLLARAASNEPAAVAAVVREIAAAETDDGVVYETSQMTTRMQRLITRAGLEALLPSDYTEAIRQVAA